jgi:hypothetical protein
MPAQSAIKEVRDQLSLDFADGKYLNIVGANLGFTRPRVGFSDRVYRAIVKAISLHYKQVRTKFEEVLTIMYGPRITMGTGLAEDTVAGQTTVVLVNTTNWPQTGTVIIDEGLATEESVVYEYLDRYTNTLTLSSALLFDHTAVLLSGYETVINARDLVISIPEAWQFPDPADVGDYPIVLDAGRWNEETCIVTSVDYDNRTLSLSLSMEHDHGTGTSHVNTELSRTYNPVHPVSGAVQVQGATVLSVVDSSKFPARGVLLLGPSGPGDVGSDVFVATAVSAVPSITCAANTFTTESHAGSYILFDSATVTAGLRNFRAWISANTSSVLTLGVDTLPASVAIGDTFRILPVVPYSGVDYDLNTVNLLRHIPDICILDGATVEVLDGLDWTDPLTSGTLPLNGAPVFVAQAKLQGANWDVIQSYPNLVEILLPEILHSHGLRGNAYLHTTRVTPPPSGVLVDELTDESGGTAQTHLVTNFPFIDVLPIVGVVTLASTDRYGYKVTETYTTEVASAGDTVLFVPDASRIPVADLIIDFGGAFEETQTVVSVDPVLNTVTLAAPLTNDHLEFTKLRSTTITLIGVLLQNYPAGTTVSLYQPVHGATNLLDGNLWLVDDVFPGPYVYNPQEFTHGGLLSLVDRTPPNLSVVTTLEALAPGPARIAIDQIPGHSTVEVDDALHFSGSLPYNIRLGVNTGNQETTRLLAIALRQQTATSVDAPGASPGDLTIPVSSGVMPNAAGYRVRIGRGTANDEVVYVLSTATAPDRLLLESPLSFGHVASEIVELLADVLHTDVLVDSHSGVLPAVYRSTTVSADALATPYDSVRFSAAEMLAPEVSEITVVDGTGLPVSGGKVYLNFGTTSGEIPLTTESRLTANRIAGQTTLPVVDPTELVEGASVANPVPLILDPGGFFEERVMATGAAGLSITLGTALRFPHSSGKLVQRLLSKEELLTYSAVVGNTISFSDPVMLQFTHSPGESVVLSYGTPEPSTDGYDFPLYLPDDPYARLRSVLDLVRAAGVRVDFITQR